MIDYYTLDASNTPIPCTLQEWSDLYETPEGRAKRRVAQDTVNGYDISTVFLGLDHGYGMYKEPMLFETMIFGDRGEEDYQERCTTWQQAEEMHKRAIKYVENGCKD